MAFAGAAADPFDIELLTVGTGDNVAEQLVQSDLAARGIRVRVRQTEMGSFLTTARADPKTFDVLIAGIPGDLSLSYVSALFDTRQRGGTLDYTGFHLPALDALLRAAADAPEGERTTRGVGRTCRPRSTRWRPRPGSITRAASRACRVACAARAWTFAVSS